MIIPITILEEYIKENRNTITLVKIEEKIQELKTYNSPIAIIEEMQNEDQYIYGNIPANQALQDAKERIMDIYQSNNPKR